MSTATKPKRKGRCGRGPNAGAGNTSPPGARGGQVRLRRGLLWTTAIEMKEDGLSELEIADALGVAQNTVSKWFGHNINEDITSPSPDAKVKVPVESHNDKGVNTRPPDAKVKVRVEARIGNVTNTRPLKVAHSTSTCNTRSHDATTLRNRSHDVTGYSSLSDLGIAKMESHRCQIVALVP